MSRPLRLGISACFSHGDPTRAQFKGKTLLYLEESLAHWAQDGGDVAFLLPTRPPGVALAAQVALVDGLILHGGTDVAPAAYGETPRHPDWAGDPIRDAYDLALLRACVAAGRPVLGVCRGMQLINVAYGGSLYQDIPTEVDGARCHRDWDVYDGLEHPIDFVPATRLAALYPAQRGGVVNSLHHQAVRRLGAGLCVEARADDGMVEAIRLADRPDAPYVFGVQWHPEYHGTQGAGLLDSGPILADFKAAAGARRQPC